MAAQDILLDDNYDVRFANGDFLFGLSDVQHLALITITDIGHWKENPFLGVGIYRRLGGSFTPAELKVACQAQYESDGYKVNNIIVTDNFIESVDAVRLNG